MDEKAVDYVEADEAWRGRIAEEWHDTAARHMHLEDGFSLVAVCDDEPVGLISVHWRQLPPPLSGTHEGYIDIIEVRPDHRRRGIASRLIALGIERAVERGAYQLRAWSSEDKGEAIPMWRRLGFGLCPAVTYPRGGEVRGCFAVKVL